MSIAVLQEDSKLKALESCPLNSPPQYLGTIILHLAEITRDDGWRSATTLKALQAVPVFRNPLFRGSSTRRTPP